MKNSDLIIDELKGIIKAKGMKYTEQRAIILQILVQCNDHLNAEDIHSIIQKKHPNQNVGIATIYRTLNFLEEVELITSLSFGKDGKKYESNKDEHHDHLICTDCGKIVEFLDDDIEKRQENIAFDNGFVITNHSMQIYGICQTCQDK
ncbi:MAG TPA: transcriptional repressor [Arcobacter sp.]|nr:transcriptional repressor [Arcobacter sp.]HIP56195.1 transcriptional repressor [Arcobacter sp.]